MCPKPLQLSLNLERLLERGGFDAFAEDRCRAFCADGRARPSVPPGVYFRMLLVGYMVTNCATAPEVQEPIKHPARFPWHEITKVQHYWLDVNAMTQPFEIRDDAAPYRGRDTP